MSVLWAIALFAIQMIVLALVVRWAVRSAIEDASESLRADMRAVLEEMQRRRGREAQEN